VVIALDRQERGQDGRSAVAEVQERYGIPVLSVVALDQLIAYMQVESAGGEWLERLRSYRAEFGV
jgi:orotate phosphoribosyltransferase